MENYDPSFSSLVIPGDVVVVGEDFGCGSSREQAVTALKAVGVLVVVASSVNQTYRKNAINNALLVIEVPALVEMLRER